MKLVKWLLLAVLCLVVVPVAVLVLVLSNIDPNQFKPKLVEVVSEHSRGRLEIQGDIAWTFWPVVGVEVKRLMYRLPEDGDQPLAAVSHVVFGVAAMPLLHGALEVDSLRIDGVHLALEKDANGRGNWERVAKVADTSAQPASPAKDTSRESEAESESSGSWGISVNIARIDILNTSLRYREPGQQVYLQDVTLQASDFNLAGGAFPLAVHFKLDTASPRLILEGDLDGTGRVDAKTQRYELLPATLALNLSGDSLGERSVPLTLDLRGGLDAKAGALKIEKWNLALASLRASGDFNVDALGKPEQRFNAAIDAPVFSLVDLLSAISQAPSLRDPNALKQVSLSGHLSGDARQLALEDLKLGLDGSQFSGRAGIADRASGAVLVELAGDKLDLDRYRAADGQPSAAPAAEQAPATAAAQPQPRPAGALPVESLRALEGRLNLSLAELKANNLRLQDVKLQQTASKGKLKTEQLDAKLYGGSLQATALLDVSAEPHLKLKQKMSGVQLQPLLADSQQYQQLAGTGELNAELSAKGDSVDAWLASLSGPVDFRFTDGRLLGTNLERKVCEGVALVRKQSLGSQWPAETRFSEFSGRFQFANGIGHSDRISGGLANVKLSGRGDVDLPQRLIDYTLGLRITGDVSNKDPACEVNERVQAIEWPVRCQGPIGGDTGKLCQLDQGRMDDVLRSQLKGEAKRKLKNKLDKLNPKAKEKLNQLIPGLVQ